MFFFCHLCLCFVLLLHVLIIILLLNSFRLTAEGGRNSSSTEDTPEKQEKGENQEQQAENELQKASSSKSEKAPKQSGKSWCFCFSCSPCFWERQVFNDVGMRKMKNDDGDNLFPHWNMSFNHMVKKEMSSMLKGYK